MLCILAFLVFLFLFPILGLFPGYRRLFLESWTCVWKKVTLQPCDINLGQRLKNQAVAKVFGVSPKAAKFLDLTFPIWAFLFVCLNVWSLASVAVSGLNLYVYDTCDPSTGESCSLSGEACGVGQAKLTLSAAVAENKLAEWAWQPAKDLGQTLSLLPSRMRDWEAANYVGPTATYKAGTFDSQKPTAVEVIDPGCQYCKQLYQNQLQADFAQRYNLTYLVYPIPDNSQAQGEGYKFQNSYTIATYLEAVKQIPPANPKSSTPADWVLLGVIFSQSDLQGKFNLLYTREQAVEALQQILLEEVGYTDQQILELAKLADSQQVAQSLNRQKDIVEQEIQTIRIPTIIFDGKRHDRLLSPRQLGG